MAFDALFFGPDYVLQLAKDSLAGYTSTVAAEEELTVAAIPATAMFDHDPGPLALPEPAALFMADVDQRLTAQVESIEADSTFWVIMTYVNSDLEAAQRVVRTYGTAFVRMIHDDYGANQRSIEPVALSLSPPGLRAGTQNWVLGCGVQVRILTVDSRQ